MPTLTVDLQEGFDQDRVKILVDGKQMFEKSNIRTRPEIGFAARAELKLRAGEHAITVELPERQLTRETSLDASSTGFLGVSVENGSIVLQPSKNMFGYL